MLKQSMVRIFLATILVSPIFAVQVLGADNKVYEWNSESGHKVKASLVGRERDKDTGTITLILHKEDGQDVRVPLDVLTHESRSQAIELIEKQTAAEWAKHQKQEAAEKTEEAAKTLEDTTTDGPKRTAAQIKAAENFKYGKANFSTTLAQFKKLYPDATSMESSHANVGVVTYAITADDADAVAFSFLDGQLWQIQLSYNVTTVVKLGNASSLLRRMKERFGVPDEPRERQPEGSQIWTIKDAKRVADFFINDNNSVLITVCNETVNEKLKQKQTKLNPGF